MKSVTISIILLIASLVLLAIYGADVFAASASSPEGIKGTGFLPFDEKVRGGVFGGVAVILSIIAFVIGRRESSKAIYSLLFINGGLIIAGIVMTIYLANVSSETTRGMLATAVSTLALGVILIGLGIWKALSDRKLLSREQQPS